MLTNLIAGCMNAGCDIVGVLRYDKVRLPFIDGVLLDIFNPSKEYNYIKSYKLYEIKAKSANSVEFKKEILRLNPDIILVGTWGEKFKKTIINLPKFATINAHPGLLPKYRGPNPYLQAIKHLEKEAGVTFHLMDENFDSGAILAQKTVKIEPKDTGLELRQKITSAAREGVCELMKKLDKEIIIPVAQDEQHASYFPHISEDEVMLDFTKSAEEVSAHIRAFHPWYKCYFPYKNIFLIPNPYELEILENNSNKTEAGTIVDKSAKNKSVTVLCGDNKLLKMNNVKLYGILGDFMIKIALT
ncbi:MAG: methionyl-tRNA formyltransferase [Candidatus Gastranaerophilales bacterium]|nr:methionyl-tRNA formyltransferase [Candidatus Gastranaerophilales bacterium]